MENPAKPGIIKISKEQYVVIKTGEVKDFKSNEGKMKEALRKTFNELKGLIRANFDGEETNQLFVTLTYAENMMDADQLMSDFEDFWKRLKYTYREKHLEYIAVAEPQERGAWHMHVLIKSQEPVLFIDNKDMTKIWGHGRTSTERLKSDDVGEYYVSYFTNLEADADEAIIKAQNPNASKKYKKGARLHFYPKYFKFYRCSHGIIRPKSVNTAYKLVTSEFGEPHRVSTLDILQDDEVVNSIQLETYKKGFHAVSSKNT
jgi:hypothetical protein